MRIRIPETGMPLLILSRFFFSAALGSQRRPYVAGAFQCDLQRTQTAQAEVGPPDQFLRLKMKLRKTRQQRLEKNLSLEPCQRSPETKMRRIAECHVAV